VRNRPDTLTVCSVAVQATSLLGTSPHNVTASVSVAVVNVSPADDHVTETGPGVSRRSVQSHRKALSTWGRQSIPRRLGVVDVVGAGVDGVVDKGSGRGAVGLVDGCGSWQAARIQESIRAA
jgi:hypothetical protein